MVVAMGLGVPESSRGPGGRNEGSVHTLAGATRAEILSEQRDRLVPIEKAIKRG